MLSWRGVDKPPHRSEWSVYPTCSCYVVSFYQSHNRSMSHDFHACPRVGYWIWLWEGDGHIICCTETINYGTAYLEPRKGWSCVVISFQCTRILHPFPHSEQVSVWDSNRTEQTPRPWPCRQTHTWGRHWRNLLPVQHWSSKHSTSQLQSGLHTEWGSPEVMMT